MTMTTTAHVPTAHASKYMQQLCKHWSHNLPVDFDERRAEVKFPDAVADMIAQDDRLLVTIRGEDSATVARFQGIVASHLDRFAFREAPLSFEWTPVA